jgi:predicted class III extradiol MEMO1 family dioxygenase
VAIDIRPAAVAGSWYPASPDALGRQVDAYVASAQIEAVTAPKAIVAPHAGLKYSGPVAAFAYKTCLAAAEGEVGAASRAPYSAAVLIGPSHFVGCLGETLALALRNRALAGDVLLVASSDLSHYEDAHTAARLDGVVLQHVAELDAEGLMRALEMQPQHACGGGPMVAVLHAARLLGATRARVLKYGDSGDVSGDKSSVVGYMAAAVW